MNFYQELNDITQKQEARDLVIISLLLPEKGSEAFDEAWELMDLAAEFLEEKRTEKDAKSKAFWESEEGVARHKEIVARIEAMQRNWERQSE